MESEWMKTDTYANVKHLAHAQAFMYTCTSTYAHSHMHVRTHAQKIRTCASTYASMRKQLRTLTLTYAQYAFIRKHLRKHGVVAAAVAAKGDIGGLPGEEGVKEAVGSASFSSTMASYHLF